MVARLPRSAHTGAVTRDGYLLDNAVPAAGARFDAIAELFGSGDRYPAAKAAVKLLSGWQRPGNRETCHRGARRPRQRLLTESRKLTPIRFLHHRAQRNGMHGSART